LGLLKRLVPTGILVKLDSLAQWSGSLWQLTPSVFVRASLGGERSEAIPGEVVAWFKCPQCEHSPLEDHSHYLRCPYCGRQWAVREGIYDFKEPLNK
jgi:Zn finger protein HypA/HybF involved in hydrogenase expression